MNDKHTNQAATELVALLAGEEISVTRLADGTGVILDLRNHKLLTINTTGMEIVSACLAGVAARDDIASRLVETFDVSETQAKSDTADFLAFLNEKLLTPGVDDVK